VTRHGPETGHSTVRYEKQDVNPGLVVKFGLGLTAVTVLTAVLLVPLFGWLRGHEASHDPPPPPMGRQAPGRLPPEPRLQVTPLQDFETAQRTAREALDSYGWVDESARVVHIPIEEAMRLLVERSARTPAAASPSPAAPAPAQDRPR
jgi:hypothetical protein